MTRSVILGLCAAVAVLGCPLVVRHYHSVDLAITSLPVAQPSFSPTATVVGRARRTATITPSPRATALPRATATIHPTPVELLESIERHIEELEEAVVEK